MLVFFVVLVEIVVSWLGGLLCLVCHVGYVWVFVSVRLPVIASFVAVVD